MNATVRHYALRQARGNRDLAEDWVQEAEIAWWLKGMRAEKPEGKSRWGTQYVRNTARTYWRQRAEQTRWLALAAPILALNDDPVYVVPMETHRQRENRLRRDRMRKRKARNATPTEVLRGEAFYEHTRKMQREARARRRLARESEPQ